MKRRGLSDKQIAQLERKQKRYVVADPEQRGMYLRVLPKGRSRFAALPAILMADNLDDVRHHARD
jgi:hypothetical protein